MLLDPNAVLHQPVLAPDGYLIEPDDPLAAAQLQLACVFDASSPEPSGRSLNVWPEGRDPQKAREHAARLLTAAILRHAWVIRHQRLLPEWRHLALRLEVLIAELAYSRLQPGENTIVPLASALAGSPDLHPLAAGPIVDALHRFVERRGASRMLRRSLQDLHQRLGKGIRAQTVRRKLAYLLWHFAPSGAGQPVCSTRLIQEDLKQFAPAERARWRRLLLCRTPLARVTPSRSWIAAARKRLGAVGEDAFAAQVSRWFQAIAAERPAALSQAGSEVLKTLLWYCYLLDLPSLEQPLLALAGATWRQQRSVRGFSVKVICALAGLLARSDDAQALPLLRRFWEHYGGSHLHKQYRLAALRRGENVPELPVQPAPDRDPLTASAAEDLLRSSLDSLSGGAVHVVGNSIHIEGRDDRYRVETGGAWISRQSDGAQLLLREQVLPEPYATFLRMVSPPVASAVRTLILVELLREDSQYGYLFETRHVQ